MVYKEGTKFMENYKRENLPTVALRYIEKEKEIADLIKAMHDVDIPEDEKKKIIDLLEQGGTRTATSYDC